MKCIVCGNEIAKGRRKLYCSAECYAEAKRERNRKPKKEEAKNGAILKKKDVCKGCKYLLNGNAQLKNICNYLEMNEKSRMLIEVANGGVQSDSCCCYERKNKRLKQMGE